MTTQEAIDYFGTRKALAIALEIYPANIKTWGEYPPRGRQFELEVVTEGELRAGGGPVDRARFPLLPNGKRAA